MVTISIKTWTAEVDKHFVCEREPLNSSDRYAVAVLKDDVVLSHLPRQLSWILSLLLLKNGTIDCVVIGERRYSSDLRTIGRIRNPLQVNF